MSEGKVLSIQSHVVSGYVGNKSATFPLQVLGFEVDPINSVQLSNHSGYGHYDGQTLDDKDLEVLLNGLKTNDLDKNYTHLLTGYCRSPTFLKHIATFVKYLRSVNPNIVYVCDPVMGDDGRMYVPETLLEIYRDTIIPLADIITPNQFEVELLTNKTVKNIDDAWAAINSFHDLGCKTVALSSSQLGSKDHLLCLASHVQDGKKNKASIKIPLLNQTFTGTGDLFAALFLAWMTKSKNNLPLALENTVASLQAVLKNTIDAAKGLPAKTNPVFARELKLIQSKADIENPKVLLKAEIHN
uniref:Pyridoxal kinase n=2 Tax=Clastoptera arizonana TaxID=38151 RepID=A0A1B6D625_9HEMI